MGRNISVDLRTHYGQTRTSLTYCGLIQPVNDAGLPQLPEGFTAFDFPIIYNGMMYDCATGVGPTAVPASFGLAIDGTDITLLFGAGAIERDKIESGFYQNARVEFFALNWRAPSQGKVILHSGTLGKVQLMQATATFEMLPWSAPANRASGKVMGASCDCVLGDARCAGGKRGGGVNIASLTHAGTIQSVVSGIEMTVSDMGLLDGRASFGRLRFLSGSLRGAVLPVKRSWSSGRLLLDLPAPKLPDVGDSIELVEGCDKSFSTCRDRFNNERFWQGFLCPGQEKLVAQHNG